MSEKSEELFERLVFAAERQADALEDIEEQLEAINGNLTTLFSPPPPNLIRTEVMLFGAFQK